MKLTLLELAELMERRDHTNPTFRAILDAFTKADGTYYSDAIAAAFRAAHSATEGTSSPTETSERADS